MRLGGLGRGDSTATFIAFRRAGVAIAQASARRRLEILVDACQRSVGAALQAKLG